MYISLYWVLFTIAIRETRYTIVSTQQTTSLISCFDVASSLSVDCFRSSIWSLQPPFKTEDKQRIVWKNGGKKIKEDRPITNQKRTSAYLDELFCYHSKKSYSAFLRL